MLSVCLSHYLCIYCICVRVVLLLNQMRQITSLIPSDNETNFMVATAAAINYTTASITDNSLQYPLHHIHVMTVNYRFLDQELISYRYSSCCCSSYCMPFLLEQPLQKSLRLRRFNSDPDEFWQDCSPSK